MGGIVSLKRRNRRIGLDSEKEVLKIVVVGGSQAGKTSIITRYLQNSFVEHASDETVNMRLKTLRKNDCTIHMEIWDVPARRKVNINSVVYENCHGVVFVLDACSLISLDMTSALLKEMKQDIGVNDTSTLPFPVILLANKADDHKNIVHDEERVSSWAISKGMNFGRLVSAKNGNGVRESMKALITLSYEYKSQRYNANM